MDQKTFFVLCLAVHCANANHRGEGCMGVPDCPDTGLTCTGSRCICLTDLSPDFARFWACNDDQDCPIVNTPEKNVQSGTAEEKDSDKKIPTLGNMGKILRCIPSTECPAVPGFTGYCNVERKEPEDRAL